MLYGVLAPNSAISELDSDAMGGAEHSVEQILAAVQEYVADYSCAEAGPRGCSWLESDA